MFDEFSKDLDTCNSCPSLCQSACPVFVNDGNKSHSPWGIMQALNRVRKKQLPFDESMAALSYQCLTCKGCTTQCDHQIEIPPILQQARIHAVTEQLAPKEIKGFLSKFHRHNNPFSKDLLKKLHELLPTELFDQDHNTVYYSSCGTISKCPEVIKDTFSLFKKLKIDFVSPYQDPIQCCGYPLLSAGAEYDFIDLAEINFHALKKYKTIITGAPACAYTLKETYKKYDFHLPGQVITINEFLKPYLKNINYKVKKNIRTKLMYHDPCYLSRYLKQHDMPREIIGKVSGYPPIEFFENREKNMCAGQGGCYSITEKDKADEITQKRLNECYENKINTVITQCPTCIFKMKKNSKKMVIKDLVSYLNDCIEGVVES